MAYFDRGMRRVGQGYGGRFIVCMIFLAAAIPSAAQEPEALCFDVIDTGAAGTDVPRIPPWRTVVLDPEYGGLWLVAGELDGDGEAEIVSAENFNEGDVHYTSAVAAQKLNGTVLWRWGDPKAGRKNWHHDVACQIYDLDGDGRNEVVVCPRGYVVVLQGATGKELCRWPIPEDATDCVAFCNLRGTPQASDVLVKNRYDQIWAYSSEGALLWTVHRPGDYRTAHQPRPVDLDGDGRDEIMAGYAMLNSDGSARWVYKSNAVEQERGHRDCMRVLRAGATPEEFLLAITCCGANNLAVIDGTGAIKWELPGRHFESIQIGMIVPDRPGPQILVDIDHEPTGAGPLWVVDADGKVAGKILTAYSRHHRLVEWTGDGFDEIVNADNQALYSNMGKRIGVFEFPGNADAAAGGFETSALAGDMTGDGVPDVLMITPSMVCIYKNERGNRPAEPAPLGTGINVTLY